MRAITLWRPWPWAIFHAGKDVENRDWAAEFIVGELVAIHAGQTIDGPERIAFIERVAGVRQPEDGGPTGIIGVVRFDAMLLASTSPWFTGRVGWQIGWRHLLAEPVPCRGHQKLWTIPEGIERQITRQIDRATRRRGGR